MNQSTWKQGGIFIWLIVSIFGISACTDTLESSEIVYDNDFSDLNLAGFENGKLFVFQNDTVSGFYHNDEVSLSLENLPSHNMLKITTEILIHDSWDGNPDNVGGPDYWFFGVDNKEVFRTTFSNTPCESTYCIMQSYPNSYFRQNNPKTGAVQTNLPGLCLFGALPNYTTRYSVSKIIENKSSTIRIFWNSDLTSANSPDPVCDESWSLARVTIEALNVK